MIATSPAIAPTRLVVKGLNGESLVLDDGVIAKWRHNGMYEITRNLANTFRDCTVVPETKGLFKKVETGNLLVMVICSAIFCLTIEASDRSTVDELVAALKKQADA
jgi:hypothetical protein